MNETSEFGFKELFSHVVGDMAKAVSERPGKSKQQQFVRSQVAVHMIMSLLPRDVIEAMLAGHCVMYHELMNDSVLTTLRGEPDATRRATRGNIVALNKVFHGNLDRLERYRLRPDEGRRDAAEPQTASTGQHRTDPGGQPSPAAAEPRAAAIREAPARVAERRIETNVANFGFALVTETPAWTRHAQAHAKPGAGAAGFRCDQPGQRTKSATRVPNNSSNAGS